MIWVNSENVRHLPTPFGGVKQSGIGRDGGDYSFDFYMETKNIAFAYDTPHDPEARRADRRIERCAVARCPAKLCYPPFNIVRLSHVATRRARSCSVARLLCRLARPAGDGRDRGRDLPPRRWRNADTIASCCAKARQPGRQRTRLQGFRRRGSRQGSSISSRRTACRSNGSRCRSRDARSAPSTRTASRSSSISSMDRLPPIHQKYALYQAASSRSHRPFQLLLARCRRVRRLLQRDRLPR